MIITIDMDDPYNVIVKKEIKLNDKVSTEQYMAETAFGDLLYKHTNDMVDESQRFSEAMTFLCELFPEILEDNINKLIEQAEDDIILKHLTPDNPDEDMRNDL